MKKIIILLLLAGVAFSPAMAQKHAAKSAKKTTTKTAKAPEAVQQSFQQTFPDAAEAKWQKLANDNWLAKFNPNGVEMQAEFSSEGQWMATRSILVPTQLPDTIQQAVRLQYPNVTIKDATKIERSDVAAYYKIDVDENGTAKTLLANESGSVTE